MMETIITELIVNGGDARGKALEAVRAARKNEMENAHKLLEECNEKLLKAHEVQTTIIQESLNGGGDQQNGASLLMVHGQDHLMDAMAVRDMALEMIEMYKIIHEIKKEVH